MVQKHYYYFGEELTEKIIGESLTKKNWDIIRNDVAPGPFSIEPTIEQYEENCRNTISYRDSAIKIVKYINNNWDNKRIVSLGVGKGILEWHLKNESDDLKIECTDFAEEGIEKLRNVFIKADSIYSFDIKNGNYKSINRDSIILMYRLSTEFDRSEWHDIFKKMYEAEIERIIFVPTGLDTEESMLEEKKRHERNQFKGRKDIFCGWLYSRDEFLSMFNGDNNMYLIVDEEEISNTTIFYLERRK